MTPRSSEPLSIIQLAGPDCVELGSVCIRELQTAGAIAMSVGRFPKLRPSVDSNEDAGIMIAGPGGVVAAAIDGHLGFTTAAAALETVRTEAQGLVDKGWDAAAQTLRAMVDHIQQAVLDAAIQHGQRSGAALSVALIDSTGVHVATLGDTLAMITSVGRRRPAKRFRRVGEFVRPGERLHAQVHRRRWRVADRLVLASDGLEDFTPPGVIEKVSAGADSAAAVAEALVRAALDGGAGDNVTAVVVDIDPLLRLYARGAPGGPSTSV